MRTYECVSFRRGKRERAHLILNDFFIERCACQVDLLSTDTKRLRAKRLKMKRLLSSREDRG